MPALRLEPRYGRVRAQPQRGHRHSVGLRRLRCHLDEAVDRGPWLSAASHAVSADTRCRRGRRSSDTAARNRMCRDFIGRDAITRRWAVQLEDSRDCRMVRKGVLVTVWAGYELALAYLRLDQ